MLGAAPCQAGEPPLGIDDCIRLALANNPTLRSADLAVGVADRNVTAVRSVLFPQFALSSGYLYSNQAPGSPPGSLNTALIANNAPSEYTALLTVNQPVFQGGMLVDQVARAQDLLDAARADANAAKENLILQVSTAYYQAMEASESVAIASASQATLEQQLSAARTRYQQGQIPELDVSRAELSVANAEQDTERALGAFEVARWAVTALVGEVTPVDLKGPGPRGPLPPGPILDQALGLAMRRRPELISATSRFASAGQDVGIAQAAWFPQASLLGGVGWDSAIPPNLQNSGWEAGVDLSWPLIDWGHRGAQLDAARLAADQAQQTIVQQRFMVETDVRQALIDYDTAVEQEALASRSLDLARQTLAMTEIGYKERTVSSLDLQIADQQLRQAELQETNAYYAALMSRDKLAWATGALR